MTSEGQMRCPRERNIPNEILREGYQARKRPNEQKNSLACAFSGGRRRAGIFDTEDSEVGALEYTEKIAEREKTLRSRDIVDFRTSLWGDGRTAECWGN